MMTMLRVKSGVNVIEAVKAIRRIGGYSLREAKEMGDAIQAGVRTDIVPVGMRDSDAQAELESVGVILDTTLTNATLIVQRRHIEEFVAKLGGKVIWNT